MLYSICRFFLHNYPCIYFDSKSHNCQNYCIYWHSWLCLEMALPLYMVNYVSSEILWLSHTLLDPNEFQSEMNAFKNSTDDMREMQTLHGATQALIAIPNNILIPTDSRTRKSHNQTFRHITTQKDTYKWSFFSTHYSTMEHLTTDNYLKSIYRLFQRTANTRCSLKHLNFKYNCT